MNLPKNELTNEKIDKSLLNLFHRYDSAHSLAMINAVDETLFEIELGKKEFKKSILSLIHQAEITANRNLVGWIERNHVEPDSDTDRWCLASKEIRDHINERIVALEKEIK